MTRRNSALAAFRKTLVGGRKMTDDEIRMVRQQSDKDFEDLTLGQQQIHINKYKDEVNDRQKQASSPSVSTLRIAEEKKYRPQLNCNGCLSLPIKPCQFKKYFEDAGGWPKDDEIYKDESWIVTEDDASKVVLRGGQIAFGSKFRRNVYDSKFLGQARSWDRPFKILVTGPLLGQALQNSWDKPALGTTIVLPSPSL